MSSQTLLTTEQYEDIQGLIGDLKVANAVKENK